MARMQFRGVVYSTGSGSNCPDCGQPKALCRCKSKGNTIPSDGVVRVARETKGRSGKGVTVIHGLPLAAGDLAKLCSRLKRRCGSGGTIKDGVIEIQGEHRDTLVAELSVLGWTVKKAGG